MSHSRWWKSVPLLTVVALAASPASDDGEKDDGRQIGQSFRVPYLLTETNHHVVRCRINGEGPFNLVVDTGAPALFLSEEAGAAAGLERNDRKYFSRIDRLEFEGGAVLDGVQTRIEDIFQLVGMNALGLPGAKIDGMLGFNVLARYRIKLDPTDDRMTWTRLDFEPKDLPDPGRRGNNAPAEVQAMSLLGGVAKLAAVFVGKQPEDTKIPRGFLGLVLEESDGAVAVSAVLPGSPAEGADILPGDRLIRILGRDIDSLEAARAAVSRVEPGDTVTLRVAPSDDRKVPEAQELTLTAGRGL